MTTRTQGLVLAFLGALLLRLAISGEYLRFVTPWMRWPLVATGAALLLLALKPALGIGERADVPEDGHEGHEGHRVPRSTWLLLLPGLVVFTVSPPALGAYLAERRAADTVPPPSSLAFAPLDDRSPVDLEIEEMLWRALTDDGTTLKDHELRLTGFVSGDGAGDWYVTRLSISCCAADARVVRVQVEGADAPPRNTWVRVTGTWEAGTGTTPTSVAVLRAGSVARIPAPQDTYE